MDTNFDLSLILQSLGDYTEDAILITEAEPLDQPGPRIVWCNTAFTKMTGYTLDEVLGQTPRILHGSNPDRRELDRLRVALERWETCRVELENFKKDGTPFWVEFIVKPVADSTGWFRYWVSVQRETTARRKQDELFATTRKMLAEAPIGLGLLNEELELIYTNNQWDRMLHANIDPLLAPISLQENLRVALGNNFGFSDDAATRDSQQITNSLTTTPYKAEVLIDQRSYYFRRIELEDRTSLIILEDVTEQKQLKSELEFAMKLESMGQLAGGVAHDFNNMLAVILGNLEIALEEPDRKARDSFINDAISTIITSRDVIRQLLTFARKVPNNKAQISLVQFLHEFKKIAQVACPDSVTLQVSCDAPDAVVFVDRAQLENAILNLVLNAIDATRGRGKLELTARMLPDEAHNNGRGPTNSFVVIEVADNGCGIAPENVHRVIEPFFSTKNSLQGTGLGLAMVHGFARQSEGRFELYSELGVGTQAKLILPAKNGHESMNGNLSEEWIEVPSGLQVLIVDDDPSIRRILQLYLRGFNWTIDEAESGRAAAQLLEQGTRYDLIITDLSMPGEIQGDDLVYIAASLPNPPRCLILTGNPDYRTSSDEKLQFILKPIRKGELLNTIKEVLLSNNR